MDDFRKNGEYCKANFYSMGSIDDYNSYIEKIDLNKAYTHQKSDFITGLLSGSRNQTLFEHAMQLASYDDTPETLWALIIGYFNDITKGKKTVPWKENFYNDLKAYKEFKLVNYQIPGFVTMLLNVGSDSPTSLLFKFKDTAVFKEHNDYIKREILAQIKKINLEFGGKEFFDFFKDMYFYKDFLKATEKHPSFDKIFYYVVAAINKNWDDLEYSYLSGVEYLLETYAANCSKSGDIIINILNIFIKHTYGEKSVDLLISAIKNLPSNEFVSNKNAIVNKLDKINTSNCRMYLYEITQDVKYLPEDVKDLFLF